MLSYFHDTQNALAAYKTILEIDPTDKTALLWLFRTNNLLMRPHESITFYQEFL